MSEYREQCNKRKVETNIKDPNLDQNCLPKRKRKKNKKIKVICSPKESNTWTFLKKSWTFGRYETRKDAEKAIESRMNDDFYSKNYTLKIEGD
jgi:hypothetical protein